MRKTSCSFLWGKTAAILNNRHSTSSDNWAKSRETVSFGCESVMEAPAALNSAYLLVTLKQFKVKNTKLLVRDLVYVMGSDFLVKLWGVKVFDTLDVKSKDVFESRPNVCLKRCPVLVKGGNWPLVAHLLILEANVCTEQQANSIVGVGYIIFQVFLHRKAAIVIYLQQN